MHRMTSNSNVLDVGLTVTDKIAVDEIRQEINPLLYHAGGQPEVGADRQDN